MTDDALILDLAEAEYSTTQITINSPHVKEAEYSTTQITTNSPHVKEAE